MALTTTTAAAAIGLNDTLIDVTSGTGFGKGKFIKVDDEFMQQTADADSSDTTLIPVRRGVNGTVQQAHKVTANVTVGNGDEFTGSADATAATYPLAGRQRRVLSYTASGAITLPSPGTDMVAVLNSTVALTMTLASPTKDQDGDILYVVGNGKAAHTVGYDDYGDAGNSYDLATFDANGRQVFAVMAINGVWTPCPSLLAGATALTVTLS